MRCIPLRYSFSVAFILVLSAQAWAQTQNFSDYNWYFGASTQAIRFSRSTQAPTRLNNKQPLGLGGSAVASDQITGNLLFYTDGGTVFDATNSPMPDGGGLLVDNGQNQPVVVTKIPGLENQYFIFHRQTGVLYYTKVDMTQPGASIFPAPPQGNVDAAMKNNTGLSLNNRSEAMIVVPHANGDDFWLITHENGTNNYMVTQITSGGAFVPVPPPAGIGNITDAVNFSYHPSGKIAVSTRENQKNVEILDFDNATGDLRFNQAVVGSGVNLTPPPAATEVAYDTEWSLDGHYLYISYNGNETTAPPILADILQFDVSTPGSAGTPMSVLPQPNTVYRSYGLQMAPDSTIYHLYQATAGGPYVLGKISEPDSTFDKTDYRPQAFTNPVDYNAKQFPAFAPADTVGFTLSFTTSGNCANAPTAFYPLVDPGADSLVWNFGDGESSSDWSPVHTYADATGSPFTVTLTAYLNGQASLPVTQPVTIQQFDVQITLVQDTTACSCELLHPKASPAPPHCNDFNVKASVSGSPDAMQWYGPGGALPGQTSATLGPVDSAGYYYLVATKGTCSTYAGVNIKEYGIQDQRANFWHFGNHAGIDFNPAFDTPPAAPKPIVGPLNTPEGCSTISDRNGQVVFSTDGQNIYDRNGADITPAPNPPGLGGQSGATQSALIVPVPGDETLYYIFTTQEVQGSNTYELRYSLFDLKLNNGTGGMARYNELLFTKSTERITSNGNWLVAHEYGNNSFRAYRVTQDGISNPVISAIGSDHSFSVAEQGQGYMEFGGNNKLIVALSTPGVSNRLETFDFADATGVVSNFHPVDLKSPAGQVYGIEYSGGKIFASIKQSTTSTIEEVFFDTLGIPRTVRQTPPITVSGEVGAIQTGPDGTIYVAVNGKTALGTIQPQADTLRVSTYTPDAFNLAGGTNSLLGLPNFIQVIADPLQTPGISVVGVCEDDSVTFSGTPTDPIDKFLWQIRDAGGAVITTSTEQTFKHLFPNPGDYVATLQLTNRCGLNKTFTQNFTIRPKPTPPTNPTTVILCAVAPVQLAAQPADDPNLIYSWSTGDSTRVITVNNVGAYTATLTNAYGCSSSTTSNVFNNRPIIELGPNQTMCEDVTVAALDAGNLAAGTSYAWTIAANGGAPAPAGTARQQQVDATLDGVFVYAVTVTSPDPDGAGPLPACQATDSKEFTFNKTPEYTLVPTDPSACGVADGSIEIDFDAAPPNKNTLFGFTVSGPTAPTPASGSNQAPGSVVVTSATLIAGSYGVIVTDQVTGCATPKNTVVDDPGAFTINATAVSNCDPVTIDVTHSLGGAAYTYNVFDQRNTSVLNGSGTASPSFTTAAIPNVQSATYNVTMTDGTCTKTAPVTVTLGAPLFVTLTPNVCGSPITITASSTPAGVSFIWTGPNISAGQGTPTLSATPAVGSSPVYSVEVDPGAGTFCSSKTPITLNIKPPLTVDFNQDPLNGCANTVKLTPTPLSSAYLYQWFKGAGSTTVISTGGTLDATVSDTYSVTMTDPATACPASKAKPVTVNGTVTVTLAPSPTSVLCNNTPFTLIATPTPANATFEWSYNNTLISGQAAATLQDTRAGRYSVKASVGACPATASVNIALATANLGQLPASMIICPDPANPNPATRSVVLDPGPDFNSFDWFLDGTSLGIADQTVTVDEPQEVGKYRVDLIDKFNCPSSDETELFIDCEPNIVAPTAFRPGSTNGNGFGLENGAFGMMTFFISEEDFGIFIFNRWGEMVYQSNSRDFKWNGAYNNQGGLLPAGTYSYVVRYKSDFRKEEGVKEKRGGVLLVR